jgi:hypothetical protein
MRIALLKPLSLLLIAVLISGCASKLVVENKMIIEGDIKEKRDNHFPGAMYSVIGKTYDAFQTYRPHNKNISFIEIDGDVCWQIGLASPFIPIPIIPIFKFPDYFKIEVGYPSSMEEKERKEYIKNIEATLIINNEHHKGKYTDERRDKNGSTHAAYFEFQIKCTKIEKGEIIIKDKFEEDSVSFFRDTSFYYTW